MKNPTVAGLDARIEYVPEHIRKATVGFFIARILSCKTSIDIILFPLYIVIFRLSYALFFSVFYPKCGGYRQADHDNQHRAAPTGYPDK